MAQIDVMKLLQDPVFQIGMGMMGTPGSFNQVVSGGTQQALANLQAFEQQRMQQQELELQKQAAQQKAFADAIKAREALKEEEQEKSMQEKRQAYLDNPTPENLKELLVMGGIKAADYNALNPSTDDLKEYEVYKQQMSAAGKPPLPLYEWMKGLRKSGAATTKIENIQNMKQHQADQTQRLIRLNQAEQEYQKLRDEGMSTMDAWDYSISKIAPDVLHGIVMSPEGRHLKAVQDNFIETHGRKESGATIKDSEMDLWRDIFYPTPYDSPAMAEMKHRTRAQILEAYKLGTGAGEAVAIEAAKKLKKAIAEDKSSMKVKSGYNTFIENIPSTTTSWVSPPSEETPPGPPGADHTMYDYMQTPDGEWFRAKKEN